MKFGAKIKLTKKQNVKFGTNVRLVKKLGKNREHFKNIPIGTIAYVINEVNLPDYNLLVFFPEHYQKLQNGEKFYQGYLEKDSYEVVE